MKNPEASLNKILPRLLPILWMEDEIECAVDIRVVVPPLVLVAIVNEQIDAARERVHCV